MTSLHLKMFCKRAEKRDEIPYVEEFMPLYQEEKEYSLRLEAFDSNFPTGALGNFDSGNKLIDSLADITFLCKLNAQEFNRNFEKDHIP